MRAAVLAPAVAADELPPYSCPKSPRRFTPPQRLACLVLRAYREQTYRGIADLPAAAGDPRRALGLARMPDYSTLHRFADRAVTPDLIDRVPGRLVARVGPAVASVAMDATGMKPPNAGAHYMARRGTRHRGCVDLSLVVICGPLLPLGLVASRGPQPDTCEADELLDRARARARPEGLFAGGGYDAERVREFSYRAWEVRSDIPAVVKRKDGTIGGRGWAGAGGVWPAVARRIAHERAEADDRVGPDRSRG